MLRRFHRISAGYIAVFAVVHILNHLMLLGGVQAHLDFMDAARKLYRLPVLEIVLLACVAFQVLSGLRMVWRGWRERQGGVAWLQALSGAYLAFFLVVHVSAVLAARWGRGLDTNFYFAAAGMHVWPFTLFFVPYYSLALLALALHVGCALYWATPEHEVSRRQTVLTLSALIGAGLALLIVSACAGAFFEVNIPPLYRATYGG